MRSEKGEFDVEWRGMNGEEVQVNHRLSMGLKIKVASGEDVLRETLGQF